MLYVVINRSLLTRSSLLDQPCHVRWAWLSLIDAATAEDGTVHGITAYQLSKLASITVAEAEEALEIFTQPDPHSASPVADGRRLLPIDGEPNGYTLASWPEHQGLLTRAQAAARQRRSRRDKKAAPPAGKPEEEKPAPEPKKLNAQQEKIKVVVDSLAAADIQVSPARAGKWIAAYGLDRVSKLLAKVNRGYWNGKSASYLQSILESHDDLSLDPAPPPQRPRQAPPATGFDLSGVK